MPDCVAKETIRVSVILVALVSGLLMSLIGVAFNLGRPRGLRPPHIATFMGFAGAVVFAVLAGSALLRSAPAYVWLVGLFAGVTQYLGVVALGAAFRRGPLSPAWCAAAMTFPPALVYAWLWLGERLTGLRLAGVLLACGTVVLASLHGSAADNTSVVRRHGWGTRIFYGMLLLIVMVMSSSINVALKMLGGHMLPDGRNTLAAYGLVFLAACYIAFGVLMLADTLVHPPSVESRPALVLIGLLAAFGSVGGFALLRTVAQEPAALVFPVNAVASLLGGSVSSVLFFRERVTPIWFGMVLAGSVAVVLVGLA